MLLLLCGGTSLPFPTHHMTHGSSAVACLSPVQADYAAPAAAFAPQADFAALFAAAAATADGQEQEQQQQEAAAEPVVSPGGFTALLAEMDEEADADASDGAADGAQELPQDQDQHPPQQDH